ncbi:MAG: hypothetical protein AAB226_06345 [candidate division NC10 bacterium]
MITRLHAGLATALLLLVVTSAAVGPARGDTPEVLRVSAIPDENPSELLGFYAKAKDTDWKGTEEAAIAAGLLK